jgi:anti-sigma28 factor (negative regulator of flagellin synthesis)
VNIRGLIPLPTTGRGPGDTQPAAAPLPPAAPGTAAAPASPAVSVQVSGASGAQPTAAPSDAELLAQLKARLESGDYRIDYPALARALAEDWWHAAGAVTQRGDGIR